MPDVVINFATAGDAKIIQAMVAAQQQIKGMNAGLRDAYTAAQKADGGMTKLAAGAKKDLSGIASSLKNVALGIIGGGGILAAYTAWKQANKEILDQTHSVSLSFDDLTRKYGIQAGLRGPEKEAQVQALTKVAVDRAAPLDIAIPLATQLVSSGVPVAQAPQTADAVLKVFNASNLTGAAMTDPKPLAEGLTAYMTAQGLEKTPENFLKVGGSVQRLFRDTNLQLPDFAELAGQSSTLKGKLSIPEQLSSFSVLRDVGKTAEEATTALRNITLLSATAAGSADSTKTLAKMGMTPQDIDMVGESFVDVLDRLKGGLEKLSEEERPVALESLFGKRGYSAAEDLITNRDKIVERNAKFGDLTEFNSDVEEAEKGPNAVARRQKLAKDQILLTKQRDVTLMRSELELAALEDNSATGHKGESPAAVNARLKMYDEATQLGQDAYAAADVAGKGLFPGTNASGKLFTRIREKGNDILPPAVKPTAADRHPDMNLDVPVGKDRFGLILERKAQQKRDDYEESKDSWFTSGATKARKRDEADEAERKFNDHIQNLIRSLDENTRATRENSRPGSSAATASSGGGRQPLPEEPASLELANQN